MTPVDRPAAPTSRPAAMLVVNPAATTTRVELRDLITAALAGAVELDVRVTQERGHATALAHEARAVGADAVVVLGGDGTANEVIQALAGSDVALGLVPGGGANVLARALGLPADPIVATHRLLGALRTDRRRRIGLGMADERWFAFNAGMGFDAAVVARVERSPARKQLLRQLAFVGSALGEWRARDERRDAVVVAWPDGRRTGPFTLALVANTSPYSYLGTRPIVAHPGAAFDLGLDLLTLADADLAAVLRVVAGALAGGRHVGTPGVMHLHDLDTFTLHAVDADGERRALPVHVDGDPLAARTQVVLRSVPDALDVLI
jgi:diacylglycerol kinase family enzyme